MTSQLPSIQAIERNFFNAIVSTVDLSNCYPTIELEESSRKFLGAKAPLEIASVSQSVSQ